MFSEIKVFQGENPNVRKYVFIKEDICIEAVLYKYESFEKRTVLCVSVQSGCPVGCVFCGTGKQFIRNLTEDEIVYQVDYIIAKIENEMGISGRVSLNSMCEKSQIMFMSMGEPMLNWDSVKAALWKLNNSYRNADLLLSTMGVKNYDVFKSICEVSTFIPKVGLQFSLHSGFDDVRDKIIPFTRKFTIREIRDAGMLWNKETGRQVYLNICVSEFNLGDEEKERIMDLFSPYVFALTFSVICEYENGKIKDELQVQCDNRRCEIIMAKFLTHGYNVRKFDPAGQEIGAGCGQLFYVQEWMKEHKK